MNHTENKGATSVALFLALSAQTRPAPPGEAAEGVNDFHFQGEPDR